jgi:hypothetical protein
MRIARTAATLVLVLAAAACGSTPTGPGGEGIREPEKGRSQVASPQSAVPRKGGNLIGSGT